MMALRSASPIRAQLAISLSRRPQPSQYCVSGEMRQTLTQGLAMGSGGTIGNEDRTEARLAANAMRLHPRREDGRWPHRREWRGPP